MHLSKLAVTETANKKQPFYGLALYMHFIYK